MSHCEQWCVQHSGAFACEIHVQARGMRSSSLSRWLEWHPCASPGLQLRLVSRNISYRTYPEEYRQYPRRCGIGRYRGECNERVWGNHVRSCWSISGRVKRKDAGESCRGLVERISTGPAAPHLLESCSFAEVNMVEEQQDGQLLFLEQSHPTRLRVSLSRRFCRSEVTEVAIAPIFALSGDRLASRRCEACVSLSAALAAEFLAHIQRLCPAR